MLIKRIKIFPVIKRMKKVERKGDLTVQDKPKDLNIDEIIDEMTKNEFRKNHPKYFNYKQEEVRHELFK